MPYKRRQRAAVELPRGVHKVISRGREYFYFQAGRGTDAAGPRVRLPSDPRSPEFWSALRQAQGVSGLRAEGTLNAVIDEYMSSAAFLSVSSATQYRYKRSLAIAREAWGNLPADALRPAHVLSVFDGLSSTPANANAFLGMMRTLSAWARARDLISQNPTEGIKPNPRNTGHEPWSDDQIAAANNGLKGMIRSGFLLYLYTGQRGSDVVRLGWTDIEDGGFRIRQQKTGREVWCPIVPELAAEMAAWEKRPGPFLRRPDGKPYDRKMFWKHFDEAKAGIPELSGVTLHGLRCTAVVRLRRAGLSTGQIGDIVGMSLPMIERYCRFADRKISGKVALMKLTEHKPNDTVKRLKNRTP